MYSSDRKRAARDTACKAEAQLPPLLVKVLNFESVLNFEMSEDTAEM